MTDDQKERSRPRGKFNFVVDIDGVGTSLQFQDVSGLEMQTQPVENREGRSGDIATAKTAGTAKSGSVTLKRGLAAMGDRFSEWHALFKENTVERAAMTITLLDESGSPMVVWTLTNAFPRKVSAADFNADGNEVAIESIELEHEGLTIANCDD